MDQNKHEQFKQYIKDCWWRLAILIAIILTAITLIIHGWPTLNWNAIGASATVVIGIMSFYIGWTQKKWIKEEREYYKTVLIEDIKSVFSILGNNLFILTETIEDDFCIDRELYAVFCDDLIKLKMEIERNKNKKYYHLIDQRIRERISHIENLLDIFILLVRSSSELCSHKHEELAKDAFIKLKEENNDLLNYFGVSNFILESFKS